MSCPMDQLRAASQHQTMADRLRSGRSSPSPDDEGYDANFRWLLPWQSTSVKDLDMYLADLYEGIDAKIRATGVIYTLATRTDWLYALASHGSALGALARVLREEGRRSFNLRFNILSIFFMFSLFHKFHKILLEQKVGKTTLTMVALEVQRSELQLTVDGASSLCEPGTSERARTAADATFVLKTSKQERLLYMSVYLLFNMAEDINVEKKMKKYNLVEKLCKLLCKTNVALLIITVMFLKKLSIFEENKDAMKENGVIYRLAGLLSCRQEALVIAVLRLLWNLSFDADLRRDMIKCKLLQTLVMLLKEKRLEHLVGTSPISLKLCPQVFGLLYNLSTDLECRLKFADADILSIVLEVLVEQPMKPTSGEVVALSVNLTSVPRTPDFNCKPNKLEELLMRAVRFGDPLLVKVIRNMSQHENVKSQLVDFIPALVNLLLRSDNGLSLQVEVLGILNNMSSLKGSFDCVLAETALIKFLHSRICLGSMEDDILLEIAMFVGDICSKETALMISQGDLVHKLSGIFVQNRHDTELALQLLYTFGQFLLCEATKKDLLGSDPRVVIRILDLSQDRNPEVAKMADILVNTICEVDEEWNQRIIRFRFPRLTRERS